jgi:hypothetical protein
MCRPYAGVLYFFLKTRIFLEKKYRPHAGVERLKAQRADALFGRCANTFEPRAGALHMYCFFLAI